MALPFGSHNINSVLVVDDEKSARLGYGYSIQDLGLKPVFQSQPLPSLSQFVTRLRRRADAVFSDYHLCIKANYAKFDGDSLVAACYQRKIPAILCTAFADIDHHLNRALLRYIPALLRSDDAAPESIQKGFQNCINEFSGRFLPVRKPWRTLLRVYDVDATRKECHVIIPGRNVNEKITLHFDNLPKPILQLVAPGKRFHAQVNLGVENSRDLYFDAWEAN